MKIEAIFVSEDEIVEDPEVIHTADFEGADTQGWTNRGNLTVELSDKFARTGSKSLEVVPGDGGWLGGASVQLKDYIEAGVKYSFSGWLYHESETPIAVTMQAQYILDDGTEKGEEKYDWLHHIPEVPSGEWVKFEQERLVPENIRDDTFLFFFEIVNGDHKQNTFYLDDIMVVEVAE
jgi:endo-1,4-beta-xylanase